MPTGKKKRNSQVLRSRSANDTPLLADRPWREVEELNRTHGRRAVIEGGLSQLPREGGIPRELDNMPPALDLSNPLTVSFESDSREEGELDTPPLRREHRQSLLADRPWREMLELFQTFGRFEIVTGQVTGVPTRALTLQNIIDAGVERPPASETDVPLPTEEEIENARRFAADEAAAKSLFESNVKGYAEVMAGWADIDGLKKNKNASRQVFERLKSSGGNSTWAKQNPTAWNKLKGEANTAFREVDEAITLFAENMPPWEDVLRETIYDRPDRKEQLKKLSVPYIKLRDFSIAVGEAYNKLAIVLEEIENNLDVPQASSSKGSGRTISRAVLRRTYPYGNANTTPHIHHYGTDYHLKIPDRGRIRRYNLISNGQVHPQAAEALTLNISPQLEAVIRAIVDG